MPQFTGRNVAGTPSKKGTPKSATETPSASSQSSGSTSDRFYTPQSGHNFSDLTNLVKKKWYSSESPSPSLSRKPKSQLSPLVSVDELPSQPPIQHKKHPALLVSVTEDEPIQSLLSPLAQSIPHPSPKGSSLEDLSTIKSPWHWTIKPYEHWSQATPTTQECTENKTEDNKMVPFPSYVEPVVPGYDFTTGRNTDSEFSGHSYKGLVATRAGPPISLFRATAPTLQDDGLATPDSLRLQIPTNHTRVYPRMSRRSTSAEDTIKSLPVASVQTTVIESSGRGHTFHTKFDQSPTKDGEIEALKAHNKNLTLSVDETKAERDAVSKVLDQTFDELNDALKAVMVQEGEIKKLERVLHTEQLKVGELQVEIETGQHGFRQTLDELQEKYTKKVDECKMQQEELKELDQQLEAAKKRALLASKGMEALNGSAHLVVPDKQTALPQEVVSCFECYSNSRECDNGTRCRSCVESQSRCARWRCGVYHVMGECTATPCKLPHCSDGWVIVRYRPEW